MSNSKILVGGLAAILLAIIAYILVGSHAEDEIDVTPMATESSKPAEAQKPTPVVDSNTAPKPAKKYPAKVEARLQKMNERRPDAPFEPEEVEAALEQDRAWSAEEKPELAERFNLREEDRYDGRKFVSFDPVKIESLEPGDIMEIPIPQEAERFEMTVTEVIDNKDGTVTWRGRVNGYEKHNQVTITKDDYNTYFSMFTPNHNYVVNAKGDAAFVVDSGTLFKIPEGAETDAVIPPDDEGHSDHKH